MNSDNLITAVLALRKARRVVVYTGAGVSAESGIPTFRDADGFWQRFPPEQFAHWSGLFSMVLREPRRVAEFVLNVVEPIALAKPNAGHLAIAGFEQYVPTTVVTQNIDGLHQAAGSKEVHEIHGSLWEVVDTSTGRLVHRFTSDQLRAIAAALRAYTEEQESALKLLSVLRRLYPFDWLGRHRPNLVLFGDSLAEPAWTKSEQAARSCDVMISVGTSGEVYPAALLPEYAAAVGATVITIDPKPSAACWLEGNAGTILPELVRAAWGVS
jgi:NAD-dependent deacetylase